MNTTTTHRRTTALAIVVLAIALPLAACQTPASSGGAPVAPADQPRIVQPRIAPVPPGDRAPRKCINGIIAQGVDNADDALRLCLARGHRIGF